MEISEPEILKINELPSESSSDAVIVPMVVSFSIIVNSESEVITGAISSTLLILIVIFCDVILTPSLADTATT